MKKKIIVLVALLFFLLPKQVQASIFCSYDTKAYLKSLASNINVSYDYVEQNNQAIFRITISNVHKNLIIRNTKTGESYYPDSNKDLSEIVLNNYVSGQTYQFDVYSNVVDCEDEVLSTIYANLPYYNSYYKEEVCKGIEDYKLCSKWNHHGLSKDRFIETVNAYKESLNKKDEEEQKPDNKEDNLPYFLEFYLRYYYIILPIIILGLGYIIYRHNKKDSFF